MYFKSLLRFSQLSYDLIELSIYIFEIINRYKDILNPSHTKLERNTVLV